MTGCRSPVAGRMLPAAVAVLLAAAPLGAQMLEHRVVPVILVPADLEVPEEIIRLNRQALDDVRDWYRERTGGWTFRSEPMIVQRSRHTFAELAGPDFQAWWPVPAAEFRDYGFWWRDRSRIKLLFLAHGAGAWAGADSENGGIDSIAQAGREPKGALGGLAVVGDSSLRGILAGVCPREGQASHRRPEGGTAWWCNWNTYRGTIAHELGHTWGLPHPDHFLPGFRCDSTVITNMQCHWAWPADSLLPFEAAHLRSLPGFTNGWTVGRIGGRVDGRADRRTRGRVDEQRRGRSTVVLWLAGRGNGTGYFWGDLLEGAGRRAGYDGRGDESRFEAEVGLPIGAAGAASYRVLVGGLEAVAGTIGPGDPPRRLVVPLVGSRRITVELVQGEVLGVAHPRFIPASARTPS